MIASRGARRVVAGSALLGAATWAYHLWLSSWIEASGRLLGALHQRHAVPLYSNWHTTFGWRVAPAALAVAGLLLAWRRLALRRATPAPWLVAAAMLSVPVVGIAVASIDPPWETEYGVVPAFQRGHANPHLEFYGDVRKVDRRGGPVPFLRLFARPEYHDRLTLHSGTHPPGPILFLWAARELFGPGLLVASLASIGFTTLGLIPAFLLARDVAGERSARLGLLLMLLAPGWVLFTTTSMDGPFSVFPITALWAFHRGLEAASPRGRAAWGAAAGVAVAAGLLMSYATFWVGLYFAIAMLLAVWLRRLRVGSALALGASAVSGFGCVYALVIGGTGFHPIAALRLAIARDEVMVGSGYESVARWLQISTANLAAFLIAAGLPLTLLVAQHLARGARRGLRSDATRRLAWTFAVSLLLISFSTLFTLEVERIWLFMTPLVAIPAARRLEAWRRLEGGAGAFWATALLLCVQVIAMESFLNTRW